MVATRREIRSRTDLYASAVNADGQPSLTVRIAAYLDAARAFAKNPRDARAYATIFAGRKPLLERLDLAVKTRAQASRARNERIAFAMQLALAATLATLAFVWVRIIRPNERALEATVRKVKERASERVSLLEENPNSVGFFDRTGTIVFGNKASLELLGRGREPTMLGTHLSDLIARRSRVAAMEAFREALLGVPTTFETTLVDGAGMEVDVEATIFPNVVNGAVVGAIALAKDIREIKAMQDRMRDQSERIIELYRIAATRGRSYDEQLIEALQLVAARLGYDWGAISEFEDNQVTPLWIVGDPPGIARGTSVRLERSLSRHAFAANDVWAVDDLQASAVKADVTAEAIGFASTSGAPLTVAHHAASWRSVAIAPIKTGDRLFGTFTVGSKSARARALDAGGLDFLRAVSGLIGLLIERRRQAQRLDTLAFLDTLTGLPNRLSLMDRLGAIGEHAVRHSLEYAVLYLDLDQFKQINDVFGHATGDEVLRVAARRMQACVRAEDTVARLGGDEFVIVVPTPNGRAGAEELAGRILTAIKKPFVIDGMAHLIGVSIGIALYPTSGAEPSDLLEAADKALYDAKRAGRNRMAFAA